MNSSILALNAVAVRMSDPTVRSAFVEQLEANLLARKLAS